MQKFIIIIFLVQLVFSANAIHIECKYEYWDYSVLGNSYYCDIQNDLDITSIEKARITGVTKNHKQSKSNNNVEGIYATYKNIKYFPTGLEKFYKGLTWIGLNNGRIREIHQSDLKPFPKLIFIDLYQNDIEVLEEGLFDYNPELKIIGFDNNKIFHIHSEIFDNLARLQFLWFDENPCISINNRKTMNELGYVKKQLKERCYDRNFVNSLKEKIKKHKTCIRKEFCCDDEL